MSLGEIYVVDDDPSVRKMFSIVLGEAGYSVVSFADGAALMSATRKKTPLCILLDVHIPGKSGLDVLKELRAEDYPAPIFIVSGAGDIAMAVDAIKSGAFDFIEKPFRGKEVVERIQHAAVAFAQREKLPGRSPPFQFAGKEPLSRREQEVLKLLVGGMSNKDAGLQLGISPRTIEDHRASIMKKLGAKNAADLIRIVMTVDRGAF